MARYVSSRLSAAPVASANGYVVSTPMINGAYTLAANSPTSGARHVTLVRTAVSTADTPGVITITGTDRGGNTITETMIPGSTGVTVTSTKFFATIPTGGIVGSGWVTAAGDDTIVFGWDALCALATGTGVMKGFFLTVTAASTVTFTDGTGTLVVLPASFPVGFYETEMGYSGYLRCETAGAQDIVVLTSASTTF
jgi:hypothetical protein